MIGLVHPGEMGSALGAALRRTGARVLWASAGRSAETAARASAAGLEDVGSLEELRARSELILSVCPPHAATSVARAVAPFDGVYVDANAVSPATARSIAALFPRFVDGGVVGPPPSKGTAAMLLAIRDVARAEGVEAALRAEWERSAPDLPERLVRAERSAEAKGWRWAGELEEIAAAFAAAGSPDGFHRAAAEVFR